VILRVRVWDGEEARARCWRLLVRREVGSPETIKYSLSNAPEETPLLRLYAQRRFAGPEAVLADLARYTHRVAILASRSDGRTAGSNAATGSRP
jgi:hypothetical protein